MPFISLNTEVGPLTIFADDEAIVAVDWGWPPETDEPPGPLLERARDQLEAYFAGTLTAFDLPLAPPWHRFSTQGVGVHRWHSLRQGPYLR